MATFSGPMNPSAMESQGRKLDNAPPQPPGGFPRAPQPQPGMGSVASQGQPAGGFQGQLLQLGQTINKGLADLTQNINQMGALLPDFAPAAQQITGMLQQLNDAVTQKLAEQVFGNASSASQQQPGGPAGGQQLPPGGSTGF